MVRTLTEVARALREGEVSPVEVVEGALESAQRWQPITNAFSQLHGEQAMEEARSRADSVARGELLGALHGVPVAVKDLFDVEGWVTSGCSAGYRGQRARRDSVMVARLRQAGAVVIGKTNQHELACGGTNAISASGPVRNPWESRRISGGSSGGSAAAVATRVVPLALGTDTGGSIRIPASFCGTAGLKPGYGALPMEGAMPLAPSLDTPGPIAMTADDLALADAVLRGRGAPLEETQKPADGLRVGILGGYFTRRVHPFVEDAMESAAATLEEAGMKVGGADVGDLTDTLDAWSRLVMPEFAAAHGHLLRRPETVYPLTRSSLEYGTKRTAVEYLAARRRADQVRDAFREALGDWDALLAPATAFPAPPLGVERVEIRQGEVADVHQGGTSLLTRPVSLSRLPAISLPIGFTHAGLPIGAQVVARDGEEATLLRLARAFQQASDHHSRTPTPRASAR